MPYVKSIDREQLFMTSLDMLVDQDSVAKIIDVQGMEERIPDKILESVADKGYQSEEDMARCLENSIIPNVILPDGEDTVEISIPYEGSEDLHPESTAAADLYKCLHAGVIPDAYKTAITKVELKEKDVIVQQDPAEIPRSPFNDEDEMIAKAAEGCIKREKRMMVVLTLRPDRQKMAVWMCISAHPIRKDKKDNGFQLLSAEKKCKRDRRVCALFTRI